MTETETVSEIVRGIFEAAEEEGVRHEIRGGWLSPTAAGLTRKGDEADVSIAASGGKVTLSGAAGQWTVPLSDSDFFEVIKSVLDKLGFPFKIPSAGV